MKKYLANENGFSAVEIILVLVALGAIGTAIFFGFKAHNASTTSKIAVLATPKASISATPTASPSPSASPQYLNITQLNVKFQLPAGITDVVYVMNGDGTTAYLSSTALMNMQRQYEPSRPTACDAINGPLGSISEGSQGTGAKRTFSTAQQPCSGNSTVEQYTVTQMNALRQSFTATAVSY